MLMYSNDGKLVGINLHSATEQPSPPWERFPDGIPTGFKGRDSDHWELSIYVSRPIDVCDRGGRSSGIVGVITYLLPGSSLASTRTETSM